jgi:hypothetical protein
VIVVVWRGVVTRVTTAGVWVLVPRLSGGIEFGPCTAVGGPTAYATDDQVLVTGVEGRRDDLAVLGRTNPTTP